MSLANNRLETASRKPVSKKPRVPRWALIRKNPLSNANKAGYFDISDLNDHETAALFTQLNASYLGLSHNNPFYLGKLNVERRGA